MSREVQQLAARGGAGTASVIVAYTAFSEADEVERLMAMGATVEKVFGALNMVSVRVPESALTELSLGAGVSRLSLNSAIRTAG